ncbi:MAG: alpha-E domain-containing protein [Leptospira sp.]|nr:alpha-E domain-containing protein [Leptospira sp.]
MLTRVADSIFWMNRYIERMENNARFIDVNLSLSMDLPQGMQEQWEPLVQVTGEYELFEELYGEPNRENVLRFLGSDLKNSNSILSCLYSARENARGVRENLSTELWEHINSSYINIREEFEKGEIFQNAAGFFKKIKTVSQLFIGMVHSTLSKTEGWHFANLGRMMERADNTTRILDLKYFYLLPSSQEVGSPLDLLEWHAILKSASAYEMYRKSYGKIQSREIVEFLILDRYFPRAIRFCLIEAENSIYAITGTANRTYSNTAEKKLGALRSELDYLSVAEIIQFGLHEYIDALQSKLNDISAEIRENFFLQKESPASIEQWRNKEE